MIAQLVFALAPLALAPSRATPEDLLAALVAKTNALESFTARYRMTDREGKLSELTLSYAAPDRAAITIARDGQVSRLWSVGGEMCMQFDGDSADRLYGRADIKTVLAECEQITASLREHFPGAPPRKEHPLGPGAYVDISWGKSKDAQAQIDINTGYERSRSHLFHWLRHLERLSVEPRAEGEHLVWDVSDSTTVELSKSSGFIVRITRTAGETRSGLELSSLDVDSGPDEALFALPASPAEGARIVSDDMQRQLRRQQLTLVRGTVWELLPRWIESREVTWDENSPAKLTEVFRTLHAKLVLEYSAAFIEDMRKRIETFASEVDLKAGSLAKDDEAGWAQLASVRDRWLADMLGALDRAADQGAQQVTPPRVEGLTEELSAAMLTAERNATRAEFKSKLREPLVAHFHDRTDAAMAGR